MNNLLKLSNGSSIPIVGLGTSACENIYDVICTAIDCGYRHIDTAFGYGNEEEIGRALEDKIKEGVVSREEIWITTKLHTSYHRKEKVEECLNKQLAMLRTDYVDLYLIHSPMGSMEGLVGRAKVPSECSDIDYLEAWKGMELMHAQDKAHNIGVSNFNSEQIGRIIRNCQFRPIINQVECHLYLNQEKLRVFCEEKGITLMAYSPLGSPGRIGPTSTAPRLLEDNVVKQLAEKYVKSCSQILLRFLMQRGMVVIPKSSNTERLQENLNVFDFHIGEEDMKTLMTLNRDYRYLSLDLTFHKHYPFHIPF